MLVRKNQKGRKGRYIRKIGRHKRTSRKVREPSSSRFSVKYKAKLKAKKEEEIVG